MYKCDKQARLKLDDRGFLRHFSPTEKTLTILEAGSVRRGSRKPLARVWPLRGTEVGPSLSSRPTGKKNCVQKKQANTWLNAVSFVNSREINVYWVPLIYHPRHAIVIIPRPVNNTIFLLTTRWNFRFVFFSDVSVNWPQWRREPRPLLELGPM